MLRASLVVIARSPSFYDVYVKYVTFWNKTRQKRLITDRCNIYVPLVIKKAKPLPIMICIVQNLAKSGKIETKKC